MSGILEDELIFILNILYQKRCFTTSSGYNSKKMKMLFSKKYSDTGFISFDDAVKSLLNNDYIGQISKKEIKYYIINMKKAALALDSHGISIPKGRYHKL